jgi:hypothetical protein
MLSGGPSCALAFPVNPTKTSKGKMMKNLVLLIDSKITDAKLILSNYSKKIISSYLILGNLYHQIP